MAKVNPFSIKNIYGSNEAKLPSHFIVNDVFEDYAPLAKVSYKEDYTTTITLFSKKETVSVDLPSLFPIGFADRDYTPLFLLHSPFGFILDRKIYLAPYSLSQIMCVLYNQCDSLYVKPLEVTNYISGYHGDILHSLALTKLFTRDFVKLLLEVANLIQNKDLLKEIILRWALLGGLILPKNLSLQITGAFYSYQALAMLKPFFGKPFSAYFTGRFIFTALVQFGSGCLLPIKEFTWLKLQSLGEINEDWFIDDLDLDNNLMRLANLPTNYDIFPDFGLVNCIIAKKIGATPSCQGYLDDLRSTIRNVYNAIGNPIGTVPPAEEAKIPVVVIDTQNISCGMIK